MKRFGKQVAWIGLLVWACGCSTKLDTGYEPNKLGASSAQRRGWYAPDFTVEQQAAESDNGGNQAPAAHRPGQY